MQLARKEHDALLCLETDWRERRRARGQKASSTSQGAPALQFIVAEATVLARREHSRDRAYVTDRLTDRAEDEAARWWGDVPMTEEDRHAAFDASSEMPEGQHISTALAIAEGRSTSIEPAAEDWCAIRRNKNASTQAGDRKAIAILCERFTGFDETDKPNARKFLAGLLERLAESTVARYCAAHRGLWEHVDGEGTVKGLQAHIPETEGQPWTGEEDLCLLDAAANTVRRGQGDRHYGWPLGSRPTRVPPRSEQRAAPSRRTRVAPASIGRRQERPTGLGQSRATPPSQGTFGSGPHRPFAPSLSPSALLARSTPSASDRRMCFPHSGMPSHGN